MNAEVLEVNTNIYAPSNIPAPLVSWFKDRGKRLTLTHASSNNVAQRMAEGRRVVYHEDIPEEVWKEVRYFFDKPTKWDGELHVGDCVMVAQSMENHQFWVDELEARRRRIEESANEAGDLSDRGQDIMSENLRRAGVPFQQSSRLVGVSALPGTATKATDHARGGVDLAAEIAAAAQAQGKKK